MSRFFHGDSSSESSSEEEEELYADEQEEESSEEESSEEESEEGDEDSDSDSSGDEGGKTGASRFLREVSDDSDESDEEKVTVVKSAKDKRFDELEGTIRLIENAEKISDWNAINDQYDRMNRQLPTLQRDLEGKPPKMYVKTVAELETAVSEAFEKQKVTPKKMNPIAQKGLNALRQKIRKNNRDFQADIEAFRKDPNEFMKEDVVEETAPAPKKPKKKLVENQNDVDANDEGFTMVGAGGKAMVYTAESILKHLRQIVESRGRKNTDRLEQIRIMEKLLDVAHTDYQRIRVYLTLIATRFDLTSGTGSQMSQEQWKLAQQEIGALLGILEQNHDLVVVEGAEEWEDDEKLPTVEEGSVFKIPGSVVSFVERLDDELTRVLQQVDPHTAEYVERLADEGTLYTNILRCMGYAERLIVQEKVTAPQENVNRVVMRRLEHVYFKPSQVVNILEENAWKALPKELDSKITPRSQSSDVTKLVQTLSGYLFNKSEGIIRGRAMLCQIYHLALHDHYYKARDMMLMSHLQETIQSFDVNTQILYNRTLTQVGLCAFRAGLVYECQTALQDICGSQRQKELLAQGLQIQRYSQITPEQERLERQRQLPFHMHINLELLECVYLTCSMLLEIPTLAQSGSSPDLKKRVISKSYRRMLEYHERQIFTGPPENTRDHVMQASKALAAGEWKKAADFITSIKIWDLLPKNAEIKKMLEQQIQEEGVRTYLFTYAPFYDTLAISHLAGMFDLPESKVTALVSKMIHHEELAAALDQVNSAIIFRKGVELSRLQSLALTMSDKAQGLIEANERTLEQRTAGSANAFERQGGQRGRGGARGRGGRGGAFGGRGGGRGGGFTGGALGNAIRAQ
ncbi:Eukaryotic translation initiation factor 3 subunit [Hortaea werneckii]|uniref:Eukaryotic translation initiation factor 3 subunit C n=2 Tax=Hortaea werneckii TaxID=91943 RepID=A0A3M7I5X0_HORWE|nr:Eukaryotic translation initiation factor 3 subunit [Hortaea werneckii]OTA38130.1 Eukaryotic translation initiation factor 3 subunit C [Hortaea werneckii EXF-2000]KAI6818080.1 Eukaryotic translation initiation factor 3 subunit [Hortaea werneckii]KAI6916589.1 Eukaryotic translation initiation factor 3 subunit [Hortaea werneckii]KAI6926240.1 Eukaryotic translation initiation factor 3 subunit [Hortaea werneckii]